MNTDLTLMIADRSAKLRQLLGEMTELSQPRSDFALRHFVVGQHDMPARQRQQALLELQGMLFELADRRDDRELILLDINELQEQLDTERLSEKPDERKCRRLEIQIGQRRRAGESLDILLTGRLRECDTLYAMLQEMPAYTAEQLEAEETEYWSKRLSRQFFLGQRDVGGNLTAVLQMLTLPGHARPELGTDFVTAIKALGLTDEAIKLLNGGNQ